MKPGRAADFGRSGRANLLVVFDRTASFFFLLGGRAMIVRRDGVGRGNGRRVGARKREAAPPFRGERAVPLSVNGGRACFARRRVRCAPARLAEIFDEDAHIGLLAQAT